LKVKQVTSTDEAITRNSAAPGWHCLVAALLVSTAATTAQAQMPQSLPGIKTTFVRLSNNTNALLTEPAQPGPKSRVVVINAHPGKVSAFEYFSGRQLVARGYRQLGVNFYGDEITFEELLAPIAAAVRYARSLPGVEKVVLVGHSGGGPELSYYAEVSEKGPAACQQPDRLIKCDTKDATDLPKIDGLVLAEANIGAPHRTISIDPAVDTRQPEKRNPALDMYAPQNGFDPNTNTASYSAEFVKRYFAAEQKRSESLIADALAKVKAIDAHTGPYNDDEPLIIAGMAENSMGSRLNLADGRILAQTHGAHLHLKADGTTPVEIAHSTRKPGATAANLRDTVQETTQMTTVRHYLSYLAATTTPAYELTKDDIKGVDWRSSANSAPGNVENVTVPTLVMAGSCTIHMVPLEITYDHSAAKDKDFVVVEGADHSFRPCRPEFGDAQKRAFDYMDAWLAKRF
jgi:pimeloyl-ACP methyl ester carboxylesterase